MPSIVIAYIVLVLQKCRGQLTLVGVVVKY